MELTAIILAGGQSRRMGANKALLSYRGKPLIRYSIDLAFRVAGNVLISSNDEELKSFGLPVIKDISEIRAPLAGIHAGLNASRTEWNLVLTCDMPHITESLVQYLTDHATKETLLLLPGHGDYVEPLCGLYQRSLIPVIESCFMEKKYAPLDLFKKVNYRILPVEGIVKEDPSFLFRNMNEKMDLFI